MIRATQVLLCVVALSACASPRPLPVVLDAVPYSYAQTLGFPQRFVACTDCGAPTRKTLAMPVVTPRLPAPVPRAIPALIPAPVPPLPPVVRDVVVLFDVGMSSLSVDSKFSLSELLPDALLAKSVRVIGYTDVTGSESLNDRLALRRAQAVGAWLVAHGVPESRVVTAGDGKCCYAATNATVAGRRVNRRAVVSLSIPVRNTP